MFVECLLHCFSAEIITNKICFPLWTLPQLGFALSPRGEALALVGLPTFPASPAEAHCSVAELSLCEMAQKVAAYIFMTAVLSKGRIPRTKQYYGATAFIWIVFYGFSEVFCPLPNTVLKLS